MLFADLFVLALGVRLNLCLDAINFLWLEAVGVLQVAQEVVVEDVGGRILQILVVQDLVQLLQRVH